MTQDEIIEMAVQAGMYREVLQLGRNLELLTSFAKLVTQHERERLTDAAMKAAEKAVDVAMALEREACAKICDDWPNGRDDVWEIGNAIRARGQA